MSESTIGRSVPRKDGRDKVTGQARYVDDLSFTGMIYGTTVRSPIARGRIKKIVFDDCIPWSEFTVVTAQDLPGPNYTAHITKDQPCLVDEFINHAEEAVVLLAHPDHFLVEKARNHVHLEIEPFPAVLTIEDSLAQKEIIWGKDNIFKTITIQKGDVDTAWAKADFIIEGEYTTGAQEQLYLEPNGMIAIANPKDGVTVWGSMQCPYYIHHALTDLFELPADKVRVIQAETGGAFGGKEDYPSVLANHAALLAWKSGKPVKMIYDRAEDMAATTKRHPSRTHHKTAVTKDGKLLAMDIDFVLDGGAYVTMSPVVLSRGALHAAGPYDCPHVRILSRAVATNVAPHGAFRGFGVPQSIFALERHMDEIAKRLGITPEEIRRRNFIKEGQTMPTGQLIRENVQLPDLLDAVFKESNYHQKREQFAEHNKTSPIKKGIGFSAFMHGGGFTGSGEKNLASIVAVEATPQGRIRILASSTEMGQGKNTVFAQIAADALKIDFDLVDVPSPDTALVPNSGPTVASRTTMIVGKLVETAAVGLQQILIQGGFLKKDYTSADFQRACTAYVQKMGPLKSFSQYKQPDHIHWDDANHRGEAYGVFAWAIYLAEVSVDTRTYETQVDRFVAAQEIGRVMNPILAEGQIEGGVVQGIGYSLCEEVVWKDGRMINNRLTNYIIPTAQDVPPIKVIFAETPYAYGPSGAKGIGELPLDGVAPAVLNAVTFATGLPVNRAPMLPENLMKLMKQRGSCA